MRLILDHDSGGRCHFQGAQSNSEALGRKGVFPGFDRLSAAAVGWFTF